MAVSVASGNTSGQLFCATPFILEHKTMMDSDWGSYIHVRNML